MAFNAYGLETFLHSVHPMRKRRAGKHNFTQILQIPTLFCPNGLKMTSRAVDMV